MACLDLEQESYLKVAGRLYISDLYKKVYGSDTPWRLQTQINKMQELGYYRTWSYTEDELNIIDLKLNHTDDFNMNYSMIKQYENKYFVKDFITRTMLRNPSIFICKNCINYL